MSRILVSLGGNALGTDFDELVESVGVVAKPIVGLIEAGHEIVICHGNGPQVGMIKSSIDHGRASYQQPSMLPKIRAALRFTTSGPGRKTLITSLDKLVEGLKGQTGTWIVP